MTDPTRLHESETASLDVLLLRAGREYAPPSARLGRIAAGISGAGAAFGASSVAGASAAGLGFKAWGPGVLAIVKWLGIGALTGTTLSVTAAYVETRVHPDVVAERTPAAPESPRASIATEHTSQPDNPAPLPASEPAPVEPGARAAITRRERTAQPVIARGSAEIPRLVTSPPTEAPSAPSAAGAEALLREEVAALGLAKAALDRGAPEEVLALVSAYRVRFPR